MPITPTDALHDIAVAEPDQLASLVISCDDWVLLKPEVARRYLEPPRLERLEVTPAQAAMQPGASVSFAAHGLDQHGDPYAIPDVHWTSSGGRIDGAGHFAAESAGFYTVTVEDSGRSAEAHVQVSTVVVEPQAAAGGLWWTGQIPPQKWTQLYTRVLTKVAGRPGLQLRLELRLPHEAEVTDATRAEIELALRELGLDDDVREG